MLFKNVTVYGGGLIGGAWATVFAKAGLNLTVYDVNEERLEDSKHHIQKMLNFFADPEVQVLTQDQADAFLNAIKFTDNVREAVENAEFIQENTPERLPIKQSVIEAIEEWNTTAIISSSTSGLLVTDIQANAKHPERIVAGHPFNPVHLMPLVEVCAGDKTSAKVVADTAAFYDQIGKVGVILDKETPAFIVNRLQRALSNEVRAIIEEGICSVEALDNASVFGFGMRLGLIGPLMVNELAGGDGGFDEFVAKYMRGDRPDAEYYHVASAGVKAELNNRAPEFGNDHFSLERFRDLGLINLLKLHKKL